MNADWQTIVALVCVLIAGHFVVRRILALIGGPGKSECGSCASGSPPSHVKPLVDLDSSEKQPP